MLDQPQARIANKSLPIVATDLVYDTDKVNLLTINRLCFNDIGPTVIIGPNGAGKSLLLRLLHGLVTPTHGRITFGGADPDKAIRHRQSMVFQRPVILRRSVAANLAYPLHGYPVLGKQARIKQALSVASLLSKSNQAARTLSGGEQQLLSVLRALITDPDVLFLDEPTSNLDPSMTHRIESMILQASKNGTKVIMVSHDMGQAKRIASDVVVCHAGTLIEHSDAGQFFDRPATTIAEKFISGHLII